MASKNPTVREFAEAVTQYVSEWHPDGRYRRPEEIPDPLKPGELRIDAHPMVAYILLRDPWIADSPAKYDPWGITPLNGIDVQETTQGLAEGEWRLIVRATGEIRAQGVLTELVDDDHCNDRPGGDQHRE